MFRHYVQIIAYVDFRGICNFNQNLICNQISIPMGVTVFWNNSLITSTRYKTFRFVIHDNYARKLRPILCLSAVAEWKDKAGFNLLKVTVLPPLHLPSPDNK